MLSFIAREWWVFLVRGIAAIAFGIAALVWPGPTLYVLVTLFGAYVLVDGVTMLVALIRGDPLARRHAWAVGIMGVLGIVAGIVTFAWPDATALTLLYVIAFWAIAMGVIQMIAAVALRREIDGEFWMGLGGLLSVVFGVYLIVFPGCGPAVPRLAGRSVGHCLRRLEPRPGLPPSRHRQRAQRGSVGQLAEPAREPFNDRPDRTTTAHPTVSKDANNRPQPMRSGKEYQP